MNSSSNECNKHKIITILLTSIFAAVCFGFAYQNAALAQTPVVSEDRMEVATSVPVKTLVPVTAEPTRTLSVAFTGTVTDENGKPLAATVTINGQAFKTSDGGVFKMEVPRTQDGRYVVNAESPGYVSVSQIHSTGALGLSLQLKQAQRFEIDPRRGVDIADSRGTQIVIPPNSLVDANGKPAEGPLTLLMYTYDLTREDMVGDMSGINLEGQLVSMESAGAFFAEFVDGAGNRYNLAPSAFAEVSIPIEQTSDSERLVAPENLVLWSYDPASGLWKAEELTQQQDGRHVGRVSHFSTWNFDWEKRDPACIRLTVDQDYLDAHAPIYVQAVLQTTPVRVRNLVITDQNNALYNLPANTDVHFFTPPPYTPPPFAIVNTGAPWGGIGRPLQPYDACNGELHIDGRGKIEGTKFNDINGNGVQDAGEPGIPGWTIEVYDGAGNLVTSILTGANGDYSLDLPPGTYTVSEVLVNGWSQTFPAAGGSHTVTVTFNTTAGDINFGNQYAAEPCRPLDVVFVVDDTGSMGSAINNVKDGLSDIVGAIIGASGGDYQMGLVTFKDNITIHDDLAASNAAAVLANISSLTASGGNGIPEASDEALNTVINNLTTAGRPEQNIDFNGVWRPGARKLIVLITDAPPAGFDDTYTPGVDDVNAHAYAVDAQNAGIEIAAVYISRLWNDAIIVPIMQDYATTTSGIYTQTASDGSGTAAAIVEAIQACPEPDVAIEKLAKPDPFQAGEPGNYVLEVTNSGDGPTIGSTWVVDTLPAGIIPITVTVTPAASGWNCTISGQDVQCELTTPMAPGNSYTFTIEVKVTDDAVPVVKNCAAVKAEADSDTSNNESCIKTEVLPSRKPDVTVKKSANPTVFQAGESASYVLEVTNIGTGPTTGSTWMTDTLPAGVVPITVTVAPLPNNWTCAISGQDVKCELTDPLAPGDSYTFTIETEVTDDAVPGVKNCAYVGTEMDSDTSNNESCIKNEVRPSLKPDVTVEKSAKPDPFQAGETGYYVLEVTNSGDGPTAGSTWVVDTLPTGVVPITVTVSPAASGWNCTISGQDVQCELTTPMAPGDSYTFTIEAEVTDDAVPAVKNCATVRVEKDSDTSNNESCIETEVIPSEPVVCVAPPSNMVAWWTLDETTGTTSTDIALYPNNGTHVNSPAPTAGMVDGALSFNGTNYVEVPSHSEINFGVGDLSIDAWVKTTDRSGVKVIVDKRYEDLSRDTQGYSLFLSGGQLGFQLADGDGTWFCSSSNSSSCTNYGSGVSVADGEWHFVAVTVDRDDPAGGRFYVDGALVSTFNPTVRAGSLDNDKPLRIASRSSFETGLFKGEIDEVELFDRVLTPGEIESIYAAGSAGKCKDQTEKGKIRGTKWLDTNGNGVQDAGEPGLEGWTILLVDAAGTVVSTVTDADGNYWFMDLATGTYTVVEIIQSSWTQTYPTGGGHTVSLGAGEAIENIDFGNWRNSDEWCHVGWDINHFNDDVNTVEVGMRIYNNSAANADYQLNVVGYPGFTVNGFTATVPFNPQPPTPPVSIPSMSNRYVAIFMSPLPTFTGPSGQYQVIVTNPATGHSFGCSAQLWQSDLLGVQPEDNVLAMPIQPLAVQEVVFELHNLAEEEVVAQIRFEEMFGVPGREVKAIRLNGQEPGQPALEEVKIPAGEMVKVAVEVELIEDIPNGAGDIILFADVDGDGEADVASSVLVHQEEIAEVADIYITPADGTVLASELYTVEVRIDNIENFYGNQIEISFDPAIVEVVDAYGFLPGVQIEHGNFLAQDTVIKNIVNNADGTIKYSTSFQGNKPGVNGSGVLARITFRGLVSGTSPIALGNVVLSDPQSVAIEVRKGDGQVVVQEPDNSYHLRGQLTLERRGENNNSGAEVCVDAQCVITGDDGSFALDDVPAAANIEVRRQSYLRSTYAYSADAAGLVNVPSVTLLGGDINQDGVINIDDAALVGMAWQSTSADAHWDVRADVTDDGKVDILDMVAVQFNWNETAPGPWGAAISAASRRSVRPVAQVATVEGVYVTDAEAQVAIAPTVATIEELNGSTKVDIMVEDVTDLYAFTVVSAFDPEKVQVVDINPTETGVQIQVGDLLDPEHQFVVINQVDNEAGTLELSVTQTHPAEAKSGSGVLGTVTFEAVGTDESVVGLTSSTRLVDNATPDPQVIAVTMTDGMLQLPFGGMDIFLPIIVR